MRAPTPPTEFDGGAPANVAFARFALDARHDWRPIALCGRGGTAEVWHVTAPDGREAALKRLLPELRHVSTGRELLRREFALLRAVPHPALVRPLELVEHDDGPGLVLEYLPKGDLVSLLGAPVRHWLPALGAVLKALTALHAHGVAHGDLKARNVLFAHDGSVRLVDLTGARAVDAPAAHGTAAYSVPAGMHVTARAADCFALAVLLYELATGGLPYGATGPRRVDDIRATAPAEARAARLVVAARPMLEAGGGLPQGLSYFADVIESVDAAGA
jgi:serine/threonine protein kinase